MLRKEKKRERLARGPGGVACAGCRGRCSGLLSWFSLGRLLHPDLHAGRRAGERHGVPPRAEPAQSHRPGARRGVDRSLHRQHRESPGPWGSRGSAAVGELSCVRSRTQPLHQRPQKWGADIFLRCGLRPSPWQSGGWKWNQPPGGCPASTETHF